MSNKYYKLQMVEESYYNQQREINKMIDALLEMKHQALKKREQIYDKCQYLHSKGELIQDFQHNLENILMNYHDNVQSFISKELNLLEEYRDESLKTYSVSYDCIMEEKDE
ncbi:hypothetical protein [Macrococcoides canis]|uniref:hypothetical protein n=1 Tax=Macrococcoides canis TaxID=1855823 RepID=UPI001F2F9FA8|nr:hypothetical protein [Macrococcus canis]UJS27243.1 hypothetical protein L2Z53_08670 [Macrococcus canis]WBF53430.1 hypothetical protein LL975_03810 [Macrococcus canis]